MEEVYHILCVSSLSNWGNQHGVFPANAALIDLEEHLAMRIPAQGKPVALRHLMHGLNRLPLAAVNPLY